MPVTRPPSPRCARAVEFHPLGPLLAAPGQGNVPGCDEGPAPCHSEESRRVGTTKNPKRRLHCVAQLTGAQALRFFTPFRMTVKSGMPRTARSTAYRRQACAIQVTAVSQTAAQTSFNKGAVSLSARSAGRAGRVTKRGGARALLRYGGVYSETGPARRRQVTRKVKGPGDVAIAGAFPFLLGRNYRLNCGSI